MAKTSQKMIIGSAVAAGLVALVSLVDMVVGYPFSQNYTVDITFLIGAALVIYMGYDSYKELQ